MKLYREKEIQKMERKRIRSNFLKFVEGLFIGLSIGTLFGILFAPKSGKEVIKDLKKQKNKVIEGGKKFAKRD